MRTTPLALAGAHGGEPVGRLELPAGPPRATALLAHGLAGGADGAESPAAALLSRALSARGLAVLRVAAPPPTSVGPDRSGAVAAQVAALLAAAGRLEASLGAPALLVGHDLGGLAALAAAARLPTVRAVATIGAPAGAAGAELRDLAPGLRAAVLLLHAPDDAVVPVEDAARLYTALPHPKSFVSLPGADHALSAAADAEYAAAVIAAWAERYVDPAGARPVESAPAAGVTASTGPTGYATGISARGHLVVADEPASLGGGDRGPTPYELLAGALGACTTMTLQMYARRKRWPLEEAVVRLRHARVHAVDCADCGAREVRLDRIERELELRGALSAEQRARLAEMADRCPVHRTLAAGLDIVTRLAEAPAPAAPAPLPPDLPPPESL